MKEAIYGSARKSHSLSNQGNHWNNLISFKGRGGEHRTAERGALDRVLGFLSAFAGHVGTSCMGEWPPWHGTNSFCISAASQSPRREGWQLLLLSASSCRLHTFYPKNK